jgi:phenylalanyl-tRNA synthetase alpha chain
MPYLTETALAADLAVRDLTDPAAGPHAVQLIADAVLAAAAARWPSAPLTVHRGSRIVDVADNYDRLGYSPDATARDARYTRYVARDRMLRSQTSALIPGALRSLTGTEALIACPGIVYRRDSIDRLHTGTPHQLDLWRITAAAPAAADELIELVAVAVGAALPGTPWRVRPATHPYTTGGREIQARPGREWVEIGECGVAAAHVLRRPGIRGLALGLGLDRLVMLRKGITDIRLLRAADPRVAGQMTSLAPYRPVPSGPAARRDLSVAMPPGVTAEELGDRVRDLLGPDAGLVEEVTIRSATPAADLPASSRERLGIRGDEVNVLLRVVLRDPHGTLAGTRANELRDRIWRGLTTAPARDRHLRR